MAEVMGTHVCGFMHPSDGRLKRLVLEALTHVIQDGKCSLRMVFVKVTDCIEEFALLGWREPLFEVAEVNSCQVVAKRTNGSILNCVPYEPRVGAIKAHGQSSLETFGSSIKRTQDAADAQLGLVRR